MKKVFAVIMAMMVASSAFAMDIWYGGKMDMGSTTVVGKDIVKLKPVLSVGMSGFLELDINDSMAIVPELELRFMNGFKNEDSYGNTDVWNWMTFEIPVVFKYMFGLNFGKVFVEAGPSFDFIFGQVTDTKTISGTETIYGGTAEEAGLNKLSIAGVAGAGIQFEFSDSALILGGRMKYDFTTVDATASVDMHRIAFLFNIGYMQSF